MSILKIYKYPHPILRQQCQPVTTWDDTLQQLVKDMKETMYSNPGAVGLAAPQVGAPQRLLLIDVSAKTTKTELKVIINPEIIQSSRNKLVREGCLSFPEYLANIKRAQRITLRCFDELGKECEYQLENFEAVAVQHEMDHLDGILLIDRVQSLKTDLIRRSHIPSEPKTPATANPPLETTSRDN